jgi:hypothetical protein
MNSVHYETALRTMQGIIQGLKKTSSELFYIKGVPPIGALVEDTQVYGFKLIARRTKRMGTAFGLFDCYNCYRSVEHGRSYSHSSIMTVKVDGNEQRLYRILDEEQPTNDTQTHG